MLNLDNIFTILQNTFYYYSNGNHFWLFTVKHCYDYFYNALPFGT